MSSKKGAFETQSCCGTDHDCVVFNLHSGKIKGNRNALTVGATALWLQCPEITRVVGHLERGGGIAYYKALLRGTPSLAFAYTMSHQTYYHFVLEKLKASREQQEQFKAVMDGLKYGNGGVGHPLGVKCLHAHVAMQLAGVSNPLGQRALADVVRVMAKLKERSVATLAEECFAYPAVPEDDTGVLVEATLPPELDVVSKMEPAEFCQMCTAINFAYTGSQRHTKRRRT